MREREIAERVAARVTNWDADIQDAREEVAEHLRKMSDMMSQVYYNDGHERHFFMEYIDEAIDAAGAAYKAAEDTNDKVFMSSIARMKAHLNLFSKEAKAQAKMRIEAEKRYSQFLSGWERTQKAINADVRAATRK